MTIITTTENKNFRNAALSVDVSVIPPAAPVAVAQQPTVPQQPTVAQPTTQQIVDSAPSILPQTNTQPPLQQIDFGAVSQPQGTELLTPTIAPVLQGQELIDQLDIPTFVPPTVDWDNVVNSSELFSGPARFNLDTRVNSILPTVQRNEVEHAIFPQPGVPQSAGERMFDRGLGWLRRIQEGLGGAGLFADLDYGDYGRGLIGSLFYLMDSPTQVIRSTFLDTARLGFSLADATARSGSIPFSQAWRREFSTTFRALDQTPDDADLDSYVWRAITGNDLSPWNFSNNDYTGEYNPLGVLGESNAEFYDEVEDFITQSDADVAARETNAGAAWQRLTGMLSPRNPIIQRLPRVGLALFVDGISDPLGPLNDIGNFMRRTAGRRVQIIPPSHQLPAAGVRPGSEITIRPDAVLGQQTVTPPARVGRAIRQRVNAGESLDEAMAGAEALGAPSEQAIIRGMQGQRTWVPPRTTIVTPPPSTASPQVQRALRPAAGFNDLARFPAISEVGLPVIRTPNQRARIVNNTIDIIPPGLTHAQVDQVIEALPANVSDELALVSRRVGPEVPDALPVSPTADLPRFLPDVGNTLTVQENVLLRRNDNQTIQIVPSGEVDWDTYSVELPNIMQRNPGTYVLDLPAPHYMFIRESIRSAYEGLGFKLADGDTMILRTRPGAGDVPVTPPRGRPPSNAVEMVAENTQRPRLAYTDRIVETYNTPPPPSLSAGRQAHSRPTTDWRTRSEHYYPTPGYWDGNRMNALSQDGQFVGRSYYVEVARDTPNGRFQVSSEDFTTTQLRARYSDYPPEGFRLRRDARAFAERHAADFAADLEVTGIENYVPSIVTRDVVQPPPSVVREVAQRPQVRPTVSRNEAGRFEVSTPNRSPDDIRRMYSDAEYPSNGFRSRSDAHRFRDRIANDSGFNQVVDLGNYEVVPGRGSLSERYRVQVAGDDVNMASLIEYEVPRNGFETVQEAEDWIVTNRSTLDARVAQNDDVASALGAFDEAMTGTVDDVPPTVADVLPTVDDVPTRTVGQQNAWYSAVDSPQSNRSMNAFPQSGRTDGQEYIISVDKNDRGRWDVSAEEHEPEDIARMYSASEFPPNGFRTRREAMAFGERFGEDYVDTWNAALSDDLATGFEIVPSDGGFRVQSTEGYVGAVADMQPENAFDSIEQAQQFADDNIDELAMHVRSNLTVEQRAVNDLVNPSVVRNPDAYDEVSLTMDEALAPDNPSLEVLEAIDRFTMLRNEVTSAITIDTDLRYQLREIQDVDPDNFMFDMMSDEPPRALDISSFLDESDPESEVLLQMYEEMLEEPTSVNIQRYLSQLEFTVQSRIEDNFNEATRQIDLLANQETELRRLAETQVEESIVRQLQNTEAVVQGLVDEIGISSRRRCI